MKLWTNRSVYVCIHKRHVTRGIEDVFYFFHSRRLDRSEYISIKQQLKLTVIMNHSRFFVNACLLHRSCYSLCLEFMIYSVARK